MTIFLEEETYEGEVFYYFLPKSAGISPQVLVSHFRIGMVTLVGAEPVLCAGYDLMELRGPGSMLQFGLTLFLFYPQLGIHAVAIDYLVSNPPLLHQGKGVDYGEELADIIGAVKWTVVENLCSRLQVYALVFHRTGIAGTGCIYSPRHLPLLHWAMVKRYRFSMMEDSQAYYSYFYYFCWG